VLPAYNAAETLERTYKEIPMDIVDSIILVDDASKDETTAKAKELQIEHLIFHEHNKGYGGNQKSCYSKALELNSDIIIMLHADYQYTPKLIHSLSSMIAYDVYPVVLGSRILVKEHLREGCLYINTLQIGS
jgi:glycosyltransferase involved in cell wall biosynthesis